MRVGNYQIDWFHNIQNVASPSGKLDKREGPITAPTGGPTGSTLCTVLKDGKVIGEGTAVCHAEDNYSRAVGRRISLQRALQGSVKQKSERAYIWQALRANGVTFRNNN
jgi:hypothetical protein